ncbi:hypothetical protein ACIBG7_43015 [Nonomuraea sp. NPDC050328]|uniref:hypothetical protein n=1 Tax=Nonomuraea sp. NPDC050328 TaxID=3364361 RepID=UPI0037B2FA62
MTDLLLGLASAAAGVAVIAAPVLYAAFAAARREAPATDAAAVDAHGGDAR